MIDGRKYTDDEFLRQRLSEKEDILDVAEKMQTFWESNPEGYPDGSCRNATEILEQFKEYMAGKHLFPAPKGRWTYSVLMRGSGIFLQLNHYPDQSQNAERDSVSHSPAFESRNMISVLGLDTGNDRSKVDPEYIVQTDDRYTLCGVKARMMSTAEYGAMNDLEHQTVVTRIWRGKIRGAVRVDKVWRIPDLTEPVDRGYRAASYGWEGKLTGMPEKLHAIEDYQRVDIFQDPVNLVLFHIRMTPVEGDPVEFTCERNQRMRIEQALIAHPDVECLSDEILRISFKEEECSCKDRRAYGNSDIGVG